MTVKAQWNGGTAEIKSTIPELEEEETITEVDSEEIVTEFIEEQIKSVGDRELDEDDEE